MVSADIYHFSYWIIRLKYRRDDKCLAEKRENVCFASNDEPVLTRPFIPLISQVTCVIPALVYMVDIVECSMDTPSVTAPRFTKGISVKVSLNKMTFSFIHINISERNKVDYYFYYYYY